MAGVESGLSPSDSEHRTRHLVKSDHFPFELNSDST